MKKEAPVDFPSFLGGVNQEVAASQIADNEVAMAVNLRPRPPGLIQRGGLRRQFTFTAPNGSDEPVRGLAMQLRYNERGLVVLGQTHASWFRLNYSFESQMGVIDETHGLVPWAVAPWNDSLFIARKSAGLVVLEFGPDLTDAAGHVAPVGILTAVENAVPGELISGQVYTWVYAFRDSRTGYTTNHSPASAPLTSSGKQAEIANFDAPPSARFDKYVLYRSLPGGTSEWLEVEEIDIATDEYTPYVDIIPLEQQGAFADEHNDVPVEHARSVISFNGRLWIHDGRLVYPSGLLNVEAFPVDEALEIGQSDAEEIVEFVAGQDRILVGKRNSVWAITGTGATSWDIRLVDGEHGVISERAMFYQNGLFVWASDDDWYASDGQSPGVPLSGVGHKKLRPFFQARNLTKTILAVPIPGSEGALLGLESIATVSDSEV